MSQTPQKYVTIEICAPDFDDEPVEMLIGHLTQLLDAATLGHADRSEIRVEIDNPVSFRVYYERPFSEAELQAKAEKKRAKARKECNDRRDEIRERRAKGARHVEYEKLKKEFEVQP